VNSKGYELLRLMILKKISYLLLCLCFCWAGSCFGLEPKEVLVVANKDMEGSVDLARYYMEKRGIPKSHFLSLSLTLKMKRKVIETHMSKEIDNMYNTTR